MGSGICTIPCRARQGQPASQTNKRAGEQQGKARRRAQKAQRAICGAEGLCPGPQRRAGRDGPLVDRRMQLPGPGGGEKTVLA